MNPKILAKLVQNARRIQRSGNYGRRFHITYLVDGSRLICYGTNDTEKTHTRSPHPYKHHHSEFAAIKRVPKILIPGNIDLLANYTLVNIKLSPNGDLRLSKPCIYCQQFLQNFAFKRIYYSTNEGTFEQWNN